MPGNGKRSGRGQGQATTNGRRGNTPTEGNGSSSSSAKSAAPSMRVPPHQLDAEVALLGAMLISADAIEAAVTRLDAADFYKPSHGHVFAAIEALYVDANPVDAITVADQLGGLLETVGGPSAITTLVAEGGVTTNASRYVDIIERTSRQRKLVAWSSELGDLAYLGTDWHDHLGRVLDLANRNGVVFSSSSIDVIDLGPILNGDAPEAVPFWLHRTDGKALIYPGCLHDIHAEPTIGKTWVACALVAEVLAAGGNVIYLDYEDVAPTIVGRLLALGVDPEALAKEADRFVYANPTGGIGDAERAHINLLLERISPELVILDGVATALARDGFDENSNAEVTLWADRVVKPIKDAGPAVVMLDHVIKSNEHRTRGARGAGAKLALIDGVSYELKLAKAYSRTRAGLLRMVVAKDRHGQVGGVGETVANVNVAPTDDGKRVTITLEAPPHDGGPFRPTGLMETVSRRLEDTEVPQTASQLFGRVRAKRGHFDTALALLEAEGYAKRVPGPGSTEHYSTARAFREDKDEAPPHSDADAPEEAPSTDDRSDTAKALNLEF